MNYNQMRQMEKTHRCSECGAPLVTIWNSKEEDYNLVCGHDHSHQGYQAYLSPGQKALRGKLDEDLGLGAQDDYENTMKAMTADLSLLPAADLANGKALAPHQVNQLILWAEHLALNANLGHVCLYHGKPYVTIDGYYYLKHRKGETWTLGTRPLTDEERRQQKIGEFDHAWVAEVFMMNNLLPVRGLGIVTQEDIDEPSRKTKGEFNAPVVHSHPQRMAEKRAEWQLLRKLIPLEEKE